MPGSHRADDRATPNDADTLRNISPVKCADCTHWTDGPPMDCAKVPTDLRYRSIALVNKHWTAESEGCEDFAPASKASILDRIKAWLS